MAFVTEKISSQDIQEYDLLKVNKTLHKDSISDWTIDRERDIYLRDMGSHWQTPCEIHFSFYWKGYLLRIDLRSVSYEGGQNGPLKETWEVISYEKSGLFWLPPELEAKRAEITDDIKEAVMARHTFRSSGKYTSYIATFKF